MQNARRQLELASARERCSQAIVRQSPPAAVLWLTGLSGAGKSTIAARVEVELRARSAAVEYLDGDIIRDIAPSGFSRSERDAQVRRVGFFASRLANHGITVICALISPYARSREYVRRLCENFVEIYISTPLSECERRDPKGLYARARRGEIAHFTGLDDPYEAPERPELTIDTMRMSSEEAARTVLLAWEQRLHSLEPFGLTLTLETAKGVRRV
jgi:adenylylsulfate kinase